MKRFSSILISLALILSAAAAAGPARAAGGTVYTTRKGDTYTDISRRYGVSLERLLQANGLSAGAGALAESRLFQLSAGQSVTVPVDLGFTPSLVNPFEYVVQPHDTLGTLSVRFEIAAWAVVRANDLADYASLEPSSGAITAVDFTRALPAGQVLLIPAGPHVHHLSAGETLGSVASLYGLSTADLVRAGGLGSAAVTAGQDITIPVQYDRPFTAMGATSGQGGAAVTPTPVPTLPFSDPGAPLSLRWVAQNSDFVRSGDSRAQAVFTAEFTGGQAPFRLYVVNWGQFAVTRGPFLKTDNGRQWTDLDFDVNAACGETFILQAEVHSADGQNAWTIRQFGPVPCR